MRYRYIAIACLTVLLFIVAAETSYAEANYVSVGTAEEFNQALGGDHLVDGNKVVLQHDVTTDKTLDMWGELVLDLNGCDIVETAAGTLFDSKRDRTRYDASLFEIHGRLNINGNGKVSTTKEHSDIFHVISGMLRVNGGDYVTEARNSFPIGMESGSVTIDDGTFESNDNEFTPTTITQADEFYPSSTKGYHQVININGGKIQSIMNFYQSDMYITVNGGEIDRIVLNNVRRVNFKMSGGEVKAGASFDVSLVFNGIMTGGSFPNAGGGLKIIGGAARSTFEMNGGTICSGYLFPLAVKQNRSKKNPVIVALRGGELISKARVPRAGLKLIGNVRATIYGTNIKAIGDKKGKEAGIQASDSKVAKLKKTVSPTVKFAGMYYSSNESAKITGFKYAYKRSAKSSFTIKKGVTLRAGKKKYTHKSKMPRVIKGNVSVS